MNKLLMLVAVSGLSVSMAVAKPITIAGSTENGLYTSVICPAIVTALQKKNLQASCKTSSGSGENFELVAKGEVTAGLMQKDVLYGLAKNSDDPETNNYIALGSLTPEAIWMVSLSSKGMKFSSFTKTYSSDSAPKQPLVIGVAGNTKSGSYLTMTQTIVNNIPSLKSNIEAGYVSLKSLNKIPPNVAYNQLGTQLDAVMFVQMPDLTHQNIKDVLKSKGKYSFLDISASQLAGLKFSGQSIYQEADILLSKGGRLSAAWDVLAGNKKTTASVHTLVTQATLLINPETIDGKMMSALSEIVNEESLIPDNTSAGAAARWWQKVKEASKKLANN